MKKVSGYSLVHGIRNVAFGLSCIIVPFIVTFFIMFDNSGVYDISSEVQGTNMSEGVIK